MAAMIRDEDIENVVLIEEVKANPALYNKGLKDYSDVGLKRKLWEEICSNLFFDTWELFTREQKEKALNKVQKRWTNLRACFSRELRQQKEVKSGNAPPKRRKYFYYNKLLFLQSVVEHRGDVSDDAESIETDRKDKIKTVDITPKAVASSEKSPRKRKIASNEEPLLEILRKKKEESQSSYSPRNQLEVDPDTNFALSLVPMLKSVPMKRKIDAQIAILNTLKDFNSSH